jgi:hypothetical protein
VSASERFDSLFSSFSLNVALAGFTPAAAATIAAAGGEYDGVVRISDGSRYGSGTLLSTGRHILTAAHVVDQSATEQLRVFFTVPGGIVNIPVSHVLIHPGWTGGGDHIDNDIAVLELADAAPAAAPRHDLYTASDEIGQTFTLVGYGTSSGSGTDTSPPTRRAGDNQFESDGTSFNQKFGWGVTGSRQLVFDYDDGTAAHDAFGVYFGKSGLGLGSHEGMMTPGDSGGPAFLQKDGKLLVAGVTSFAARPSNGLSDVDGVANSSFGEFGSMMRVSAYRPWVDSITGVDRVIMGKAGTHPDRSTVTKTVTEGGITWFLVEIGEAQTSEARVHYATRDGSAKANEDYLPVHGDVVFAPGQSWCQVMVETLTDKAAEGNETFSLVLTDPRGGHFADGAVELVAVRTITEASTGLLG